MLSVNPLTAVLYFWVCIMLKVKYHNKKKKVETLIFRVSWMIKSPWSPLKFKTCNIWNTLQNP